MPRSGRDLTAKRTFLTAAQRTSCLLTAAQRTFLTAYSAIMLKSIARPNADSGIAVAIILVPIVVASLFLAITPGTPVADLFHIILRIALLFGTVKVQLLLSSSKPPPSSLSSSSAATQTSTAPTTPTPTPTTTTTTTPTVNQQTSIQKYGLAGIASYVLMYALYTRLNSIGWTITLIVASLGAQQGALLWFLHLFKKSFTLGEASVLSETLVLLLIDATLLSITQISRSIMTTTPPVFGIHRSPVQVFMHGLILGMILIGATGAPILKFIRDLHLARRHRRLLHPTPPTPPASPTDANDDPNTESQSNGTSPPTPVSSSIASSVTSSPALRAAELSNPPNQKQQQQQRRRRSSLPSGAERSLAIAAMIPGFRDLTDTMQWTVASIAFYSLAALLVVAVIRPWVYLFLAEDPFSWTISFLSPKHRLLLLLYWTTMIALGVVIAALRFNVRTSVVRYLNLRRKYFHALAVCIFIPGYIIDPDLMHLAMSVALSALIMIEYIRHFRLWPCGTEIHVFLEGFLDRRDCGPVILSHLYLLLGCAVPVWLNRITGRRGGIGGLTGVVTLGIGDSMASIVGHKFGRTRWFNTKKTFEGTTAFVLSVWITNLSISMLHADPTTTTMGSILSVVLQAIRLLACAVLAGIMEATSDQNDNLTIPMYHLALLNLLQC